MSILVAFLISAQAAPLAQPDVVPVRMPQVAQLAAVATVQVIRLERIADEPAPGSGMSATWRSRDRRPDGSVLISFE